MTIISEFGIYDLVFSSHMPEAKSFKRWVYTMLKSLRKAAGLEGFEVFRMLDKQHQKAAMQRLQTALQAPEKVDYIKANTIADKAVFILCGIFATVRHSSCRRSLDKPRCIEDNKSRCFPDDERRSRRMEARIVQFKNPFVVTEPFLYSSASHR